MPRKKKKPPEEGIDQGWIVTFSDCMTLLLCFFVLLLTFSSFDEVKFDQLAGAFRAMNFDSLDDARYRQPDSLIEREDTPNSVDKGSRTPTDEERHNDPPRAPLDILDVDMEKDRTIIYLPSQKVFWGMGIALSSEARQYLATMAKYIKGTSCRVIIGESSSGQIGLRRSWRVMQFFSKEENIEADRFSLDGVCDPQSQRFAGQPILAITLMNVKVEE